MSRYRKLIAALAGAAAIVAEAMVDDEIEMLTPHLKFLEQRGYDGWYVLEQDTVLEAGQVGSDGPVAAAAASVRHLEGLSVV